MANGATMLTFSVSNHVDIESVAIGPVGGSSEGRRMREDNWRLCGRVWGRGRWGALIYEVNFSIASAVAAFCERRTLAT